VDSIGGSLRSAHQPNRRAEGATGSSCGRRSLSVRSGDFLISLDITRDSMGLTLIRGGASVVDGHCPGD